jgi:DNA primase
LDLKKGLKRQKTSVLPEYVLGAYDRCPLQLVEDGFTEETLARYDVGFDRNSNRITFPVRDHMGRLVAISGRASDEGVIPKYKVYDAAPPTKTKPAGELHGVVEDYVPNNRDYLYGFNDVYPIRFFNPNEKHAPLIVVEGYKACLWLRQLGFAHTVALQGSSMTPAQRRQLNKLRGPYYIFLDHEPGKAFPDDRGRCAAVTIAERLSSAGRVFLCIYPGYTDQDPFTEKKQGTSPDDLNKTEINNLVESAQTFAQLIARTDNKVWRRS